MHGDMDLSLRQLLPNASALFLFQLPTAAFNEDAPPANTVLKKKIPSRENTRPSIVDDAIPKSTTLLARTMKSTAHTCLDASTAIDGTLYSRYRSPTLPTDGGDSLRDFQPFTAGNDEGYRARTNTQAASANTMLRDKTAACETTSIAC
ncbi:hypothetical protein C8R44DRAFT_882386 [Mycena epipterygia]|nr:hypothetical protein C8R44DRAFT_882386 [Mycena epipterygia]